MIENLKALAHFVCARPTVSLVFPVHPNPAVRQATEATLAGRDRVHLLPPLDYGDFVHLLSNAWLIVSDSGGVQEEAPSLGVPLLVLRENTERPEVLESGVAKLVGNRPGALASCLQEAFEPGSWAEAVPAAPNPFGSGDAARRILLALLAAN
jgi:UDP-N-acetylglucosamine 2-epimerase